jgi:hypothetical protein
MNLVSAITVAHTKLPIRVRVNVKCHNYSYQSTTPDTNQCNRMHSIAHHPVVIIRTKLRRYRSIEVHHMAHCSSCCT